MVACRQAYLFGRQAYLFGRQAYLFGRQAYLTADRPAWSVKLDVLSHFIMQKSENHIIENQKGIFLGNFG